MSEREVFEVEYVRRSTQTYLDGHYDWKWIIGVLQRSGFDKPQIVQFLLPLKNHGRKFRSQALHRNDIVGAHRAPLQASRHDL